MTVEEALDFLQREARTRNPEREIDNEKFFADFDYHLWLIGNALEVAWLPSNGSYSKNTRLEREMTEQVEVPPKPPVPRDWIFLLNPRELAVGLATEQRVLKISTPITSEEVHEIHAALAYVRELGRNEVQVLVRERARARGGEQE